MHPISPAVELFVLGVAAAGEQVLPSLFWGGGMKELPHRTVIAKADEE